MMAHRLIDLVLERRGLTRDSYLDLEKLTTDELAGMDEVVEALHDIHERADSHHTIVVAPDFDMDGIMAGSLLVAGLAELGFPVEIFIPHPSAGYGMNVAEADRLLDVHPHAAWVMTCDMGISCRDAIHHLGTRGVQTIITDHHIEPAVGSARDQALAVVDPCGIGETFSLSGICGATVAWRVLNAYAQRYVDDRGVQDRIYRLRALAGIGTVSDLMPLIHDNRQLVRDSVALLRLVWANPTPWFAQSMSGSPTYTSVFRGLSCALSAFNEQHAFGSKDAINEKFIGFTFAPTFNAAKRMDVDLGHAFNVFLGTQSARETGMEVLLAANAARKELVKTKVVEAFSHPLSATVYLSDAPAGILGLLASQIMSTTEIPTLVISRHDDGTYHGSGRSPEWYPFATRAKVLGIHVAGHEQAFGVSFDSEAQLRGVLDVLDADIEAVRTMLPEPERPDADVDLTIGARDHCDLGFDLPLLYEFVTLTDEYRPFGRGWEAPRIRAYLSAHEYFVKTMGSEQQHLSIIGPNGFKCISWNEGHRIDDLRGHALQVTGDLQLNEYMNTTSVQLVGQVGLC